MSDLELRIEQNGSRIRICGPLDLYHFQQAKEILEQKIKVNVRNYSKEVTFFTETDNCPTCKQTIDSEFKSQTLEKKNAKLVELNDGLKKIDQNLKVVNRKYEVITRNLSKISELETEVKLFRKELGHCDSNITRVQHEIQSLLNRKEDMNLNEVNNIKILEQELETLITKRGYLIDQKHNYDIIALMLKDSGIKTKIIKQYLPIINKHVNQYLAAMDFYVNFTLDDNFKGVINSRGRDDFSYESFSQGEKLRIDLALLFTWRDIAKMKGSANTNLLILDEIFDSSLDASGTEDFMKLLNDLDKKVNVFVVSHKGDQLQDKFPNTLKFEKKKGFSVLVD